LSLIAVQYVFNLKSKRNDVELITVLIEHIFFNVRTKWSLQMEMKRVVIIEPVGPTLSKLVYLFYTIVIMSISKAASFLGTYPALLKQYFFLDVN